MHIICIYKLLLLQDWNRHLSYYNSKIPPHFIGSEQKNTFTKELLLLILETTKQLMSQLTVQSALSHQHNANSYKMVNIKLSAS